LVVRAHSAIAAQDIIDLVYLVEYQLEEVIERTGN
jgi:hypothetical protein